MKTAEPRNRIGIGMRRYQIRITLTPKTRKSNWMAQKTINIDENRNVLKAGFTKSILDKLEELTTVI